MRQINIDISANQTLKKLTDSLFWFIQTQMMQKGIQLKDIIYQKVLPKMITSSSMEKTNIKRYAEIIKLTTE